MAIQCCSGGNYGEQVYPGYSGDTLLGKCRDFIKTQIININTSGYDGVYSACWNDFGYTDSGIADYFSALFPFGMRYAQMNAFALSQQVCWPEQRNLSKALVRIKPEIRLQLEDQEGGRLSNNPATTFVCAKTGIVYPWESVCSRLDRIKQIENDDGYRFASVSIDWDGDNDPRNTTGNPSCCQRLHEHITNS